MYYLGEEERKYIINTLSIFLRTEYI